MTFQDFGLNKELADQLASNNIVKPSPIQEGVFALLREGHSVIALAKTGTGKTLAYLAPLVQRYVFDLKEATPAKETWGLILVPTRELAAQAEKNLSLLTGNNLQAVVIVGGESEKKQISLGTRAAVYIATPGRFLDLLSRQQVSVEHLKCVVFDEADRILDMGFANDIRAIRQLLPKKLQLCFFSATIHFGIDEVAYEFGVEAQRVGKETDELTVEGLDHRVAFVGDLEKLHALVNFLKERPRQRGIVFNNYKQDAYRLTQRLIGLGFKAETLTSDLSQSERTRTMQQFRDNKVQVLMASDLASRGLDVEDLDFVVNMNLPEDPATYVHRVGRTARAGKKGIALSLIGFNDSFLLERLEKFLGKEIVRFDFRPEELSGYLPRAASGENRNHHAHRPHEGHHPKHPAKHTLHAKRSSASKPVHVAKPLHKALPQTAVTKSKPKSVLGKVMGKLQKLLGIKKAPTTHTTEKIGHRTQGHPSRAPQHHNSQRQHSGHNRNYRPKHK